MRAGQLVLLSLPFSAACVRDLPESALGQSAIDLFREFDEGVALLPGIVADIDVLLATYDLGSRKGKRMIDLPPLTADDLGGADAIIDPADQIRAGMVGESTHDLGDNLRAQVEVNMTCANARSIKCHQRLPDEGSDAEDFLVGSADTYRTLNTLRIQTLPIDFWLQAPGDFRHVPLEDGRSAVVGRTWITEGFANDGGGRVWKQRFGVDLFIEDPDDAARTRRFYATWIGPSVDGFTGALVQDAIRSGLDDGFTRPDKWLDEGEACDVDLGECLAEAPF